MRFCFVSIKLGSLVAVALYIVCPSHVRGDTFGSDGNFFDIEFVRIGDPGNPADDSGNPSSAGSVAYTYRMGKFEISEDMIEKANLLGNLEITIDDRGANKPATSISWVEAARFVNWLNTSTGHKAAYKFPLQPGEPGYSSNRINDVWTPNDAGYNPSNLYRNSFARYFLPSADEWYKAAYYDPMTEVYYDYPTGSNVVPGAVTSGTAIGTAVFGFGNSSPPPNDLADVSLAGGLSPYGTMAQGGNAFEWEETDFDLLNDVNQFARTRHGHRGGGAGFGADELLSTIRNGFDNSIVTPRFGFRVVSVPESSSLLIAFMSGTGMLFRFRYSFNDPRK